MAGALSRFIVKKPFDPKRFGILWALLLGVTAAAVALALVLETATAGLLVIGLPAAVLWYRADSTQVMITKVIVRIGTGALEWPAVERFVVREPADPADAAHSVELAALLRPGAAVQRGAAPDPAVPDRLAVRGLVNRRKFDIDRLREVVDAHSRGAVPVEDRRTTDRRGTR